MNDSRLSAPTAPPTRRLFSRFLVSYRKLGLGVAVIFTLISSAFLLYVGIYHGVKSMALFLAEGVVKSALSGLIKTMDIFLAALVMMLLALGLYDLFVVTAEDSSHRVCQGLEGFSTTLDELKNSLAKLIIIILIITFFELVLASMDVLLGFELLVVPTGIMMICFGLYLLKKS